MKKQIIIGASLLILFSTIKLKQDYKITKFNIIEIKIENNSLIKNIELQNALHPFYNKNLIFLNNNEVREVLKKIVLLKALKLRKNILTLLLLESLKKNQLQYCYKKKKNFI